MKFFHKKFSLSPEQEAELTRVKEERIGTQKELRKDTTLAQRLERYREENHFSLDFRKALGER